MACRAFFVSRYVEYTLFFMRIHFFKTIEVEIEYLNTNKPAEVGILKRISFWVLKICKYNTVICF